MRPTAPLPTRQEATVQAETPVKSFTMRFTVSPRWAIVALWAAIRGRQIVIHVNQPTVEWTSDTTCILRSSTNG